MKWYDLVTPLYDVAIRSLYAPYRKILIKQLDLNKGDTVLDPFCGSGTTLVAARLLGREAIGIDISIDAVNLSGERLKTLVKTRSMLMELGENAYRQKSNIELAILQTIDAIPVQRNSGIDGFLRKQVCGRPVAVKIQKSSESLSDAMDKLIAAASTKKCEKAILIKTADRDSSLFECNQKTDDRILILDAYDLLVSEWLVRLPARS